MLHSGSKAGLSGLVLSEARAAGPVSRHRRIDLSTLPLPMLQKSSGNGVFVESHGLLQIRATGDRMLA
jgi:hypothetical protein